MFEKPLDNCSWTPVITIMMPLQMTMVMLNKKCDQVSPPSTQSSLPSMASKSELAVWIVSHCQVIIIIIVLINNIVLVFVMMNHVQTNSHREDYVQELQVTNNFE